jgi:hypothetical protein
MAFMPQIGGKDWWLCHSLGTNRSFYDAIGIKIGGHTTVWCAHQFHLLCVSSIKYPFKPFPVHDSSNVPIKQCVGKT